jgi:hypothetical protein
VSVPDNGTTVDTTPLLRITLSALLQAGESLSVSRSGPGGTVELSPTNILGTTLDFEEPDPGLAPGTYVYSATLADALGNSRALDINGGALGDSYTITVV